MLLTYLYVTEQFSGTLLRLVIIIIFISHMITMVHNTNSNRKKRKTIKKNTDLILLHQATHNSCIIDIISCISNIGTHLSPFLTSMFLNQIGICLNRFINIIQPIIIHTFNIRYHIRTKCDILCILCMMAEKTHCYAAQCRDHQGMIQSGDGMIKSGDGMIQSGDGMIQSGDGMTQSGDGMTQSGDGRIQSGDGRI